jgi:hypothetical protein
VSSLLGLHPSGTEPIGVACKAVGWQVPEVICVPVQTTPPSWPLAAATAAKLIAAVNREAMRRPAMIARAAVCFMVAATDVKVRRGPQARLGVIAATAPRLVRDFSAKLIGSDALLMFGSFVTAARYLSKQVFRHQIFQSR